jgi:hypothetical protein
MWVESMVDVDGKVHQVRWKVYAKLRGKKNY